MVDKITPVEIFYGHKSLSTCYIFHSDWSLLSLVNTHGSFHCKQGMLLENMQSSLHCKQGSI